MAVQRKWKSYFVCYHLSNNLLDPNAIWYPRFTPAELEMIEHSVAKRLLTWEWTEEFLRTGKADGMTAECHQIEEAEWVLAQYRALHGRLAGVMCSPGMP